MLGKTATMVIMMLCYRSLLVTRVVGWLVALGVLCLPLKLFRDSTVVGWSGVSSAERGWSYRQRRFEVSRFSDCSKSQLWRFFQHVSLAWVPFPSRFLVVVFFFFNVSLICPGF